MAKITKTSFSRLLKVDKQTTHLLLVDAAIFEYLNEAGPLLDTYY
jgi:hypothetical protein